MPRLHLILLATTVACLSVACDSTAEPTGGTKSAIDSAAEPPATDTGLATGDVGGGSGSGSTGDDGDDGGTTDSGGEGSDRPELPDLDAIEASLWAAYVDSAPAEWGTPTASGSQVEQSVSRGSSTMRYTVARQGADTGLVPLYIALHGGGGTSASVNDSQWLAMQSYYKDSIASGIYVAPRGITNNWNLHFEGDSYPLYDQLIERMIVQEGVDPDRVYLLGFSAGGDGVYQITPRLADRFAGANMSAGHPNGTPADNLANVPYLLQMGEYDTAYDRHRQAAAYHEQLDGLSAAAPGLYEHALFLHHNGTHNSPWSDRDPSGRTYPVIADPIAWLTSGDRATVSVDSNAVYWLDDYTRQAQPTQLIWSLSTWADRDGRETAFYWLAVAPEHRGAGRIEAAYDGATNTVTLSATDVAAVRVWLNHRMLDLGSPITVVVDGVSTTVDVYPSEDLMAETLSLRGDPRHIYSAEIAVTWTDGAATVTPVTVYSE